MVKTVGFLVGYRKSRISKDILKIILSGRKDGQWYVEPFAGGV